LILTDTHTHTHNLYSIGYNIVYSTDRPTAARKQITRGCSYSQILS